VSSPNINTAQAVDLSKLKKDTTVDLSKQAIEGRRQQARIEAAREWIAGMRKMTKGLVGKPSMETLVAEAIRKFDLTPPEQA
jgi:hypothetical protein